MGLISDTHGLLRDEAIHQLRGSHQIIHAGDVGDPEILTRLQQIAPVTVVRGNIDRAPWAFQLPNTTVLEVAGVTIYVLHDIGKLDLNPAAAGFNAVVFGHSHMPHEERRNQVLYLNPGSAGPRRFRLPITVALLEIKDCSIRTRFIDLETGTTFDPQKTS